MPFCPKCRYEYRPEISECPDCHEKLVATMPPEPDESDDSAVYDDWTPIARMTSPQYADMVVEALRSKSIPAVLSDTSGHFGQTGQMGPSSFRPVGGAFTTLYVPAEFAEDACHEAQVIMGEDWEKISLGDFDL